MLILIFSVKQSHSFYKGDTIHNVFDYMFTEPQKRNNKAEVIMADCFRKTEGSGNRFRDSLTHHAPSQAYYALPSSVASGFSA